MRNQIKIIGVIIFLYCFEFSKVYGCTPPDTAGQITGNTMVCYGQKNTYKVSSIGLATSYKWQLPPSTQIISGANTESITVIFYGSSGYIRVQGVNSCDTGVPSSIYVKVSANPNMSIISPQKYCCNYGNIDLGSSQFGSPTGGKWTCRQNSTLIVGNEFQTAKACDPKKSGVFTLKYSYQDPTSTCSRSDSTKFTIIPLPPLMTKNGTYCQSIVDTSLRPLILAPINLNSLDSVSFKLLKTLPKVGGGQAKVGELIYDSDPSLNFNFRLKVDTGIIDLGSKTNDSLIIEITIKDYAGCYNKDTFTVIILKIPEITFDKFPDLCINKGAINLSQISNAKPQKGCWGVVNKMGFSDSINLKPGLKGCDTLNTLLLTLQKGPGLYKMRYVYDFKGCAANKEQELRIHSLPRLSITMDPNANAGKFCDNDGDINLKANPSGGTWTSAVSGIVSGSLFKPASVSMNNQNKWINLTYSYTNSQTGCDSSKSLSVFVQSKPQINIQTSDIDTCRRDSMNFYLKLSYAFSSKFAWVHSFDPSKAHFENKQQLSYKNATIFTVYPRRDQLNFIKVFAYTEPEGVCPFSLDSISIRIDTISCDTSAGIQIMGMPKPYEIALFPNPNTGKYSLEVKRAGIYFFELYSPQGKCILRKQVYGYHPEFFDQKLMTGFYFIRIVDLNGHSMKLKMVID